MSVHGVLSCLPTPGFGFNRNYITKVVFGFGAGAVNTGTPPNFYFTDTTNPVVHIVANLQPGIFAVNSNSWTLDHVLKDWWLIIDPNPAPQPINVYVDFDYDPGDHRPMIFIRVLGWTTYYRFPIPPAPPGWWRAPLLP